MHLADPFTTRFTTQDAPPVAITDVRPRAASPGSYITILGTGFDPGQPDSVQFLVGSAPGYLRVPAASVTPTSVLVRVPGTAMTGALRVVILDQLSNPFTLTVLPALAQTAPSHVTDVDLGFAPTDVALGPAGDAAFAVGSGGLAVIDLQTHDVVDTGASARRRAWRSRPTAGAPSSHGPPRATWSRWTWPTGAAPSARCSGPPRCRRAPRRRAWPSPPRGARPS